MWSERVEEAKYKRCDTNDNKKGCKMQKAKCKMQNARCKIGVAIATVNVNVIPFCIRLLPSLYLLSLSLQLLSLHFSSTPSETCLAMLEWQLCSTILKWQLSLASASFLLLVDYSSVKLTGLMLLLFSSISLL